MHALQAHAGTATPVLVDVAAPTAAPGEVLIAVAAAAINPADLMVVEGSLRSAFGLPDIVGLGYDVSGTIQAVGEGVTGFAVGDRVAAFAGDLTAPLRGQAELVALPVDAVALLPDELPLVESASIPLNALTAAQALALLGDPAGRSLLVTGAAGAVGGYAIALAAAAGWRVSGLARPSDAAFVTGAGAELVTEIPSTPGFDAVLDAAALQENALPAIVDGGWFVGVLPPFPVESVRDIHIDAVAVHLDADLLRSLLERSASGELPIRVAGSVGLDDAVAAYGKAAARGQRGRWLVRPV